MNDHMPLSASFSPRIERVRHEIKRRRLTVTDVENITPMMLRITLAGDLGDFVSSSPDDHIKIFVPGDTGQTEMRDYTPRRYDNDACRLLLDFAIHEAGPATRWALNATPGSQIEIGGPRGSTVISGVTRWLLVGDETALPSIGRRIEEARSDATITMLAVVAGPEEQQMFETKAKFSPSWVHRPLSRATDPSVVIAALQTLSIESETFVWIADEASVARAVRTYLEQRGHPLNRLKAAGYWVLGKADAHEKIEN